MRKEDQIRQGEKLLRYLFRDCKQISLRVLDGGFSGNMVAAVSSIDRYGHKQSPHVVKIGAQEAIAEIWFRYPK